MKSLNVLIPILLMFLACNNDTIQETQIHKVKVEEILQSKDYTYLKVSESENVLWIAVGKIEIKTGETCFYNDRDGFVMQNFESEELGKKFDKILFTNKIYSDEQQAIEGKSIRNDYHAMMESKDTASNEIYHKQNQKVAIAKNEIKVEKSKDEMTISELFSKKNKYVNKVVRIKGQVVKYSESIMGRNWVHLQDGTESNGKFDLTITTLDAVKVGEVLTFEGKIELDKDFGYGYSYEIIMEEAKRK